MPKSREQKAADKICDALDSASVHPGTVAALVIGDMTWAQQEVLFEFMVACVSEWAGDPMLGTVSMGRAQRYMIASAIKDTVADVGYTIR